MVVLGLSEHGEPFYCVSEPSIDDQLRHVIDTIIDVLISKGYEYPVSLSTIEEITGEIDVNKLVGDKLGVIEYFINKTLSGYRELYILLRDPYVEEIACTRPGSPISIIHRELPIGWIKTNIVLSESELDDMASVLARKAGKTVNIAHPYTEGLLPEGHRVAITYLREISRFGSSFVIRKHFIRPLTIVELIDKGVISKLAAAYLWQVIEDKKGVLIVGPAASGKTTLLQALLLLIPPYKRIITIEDTPEVNLTYHPEWDSLVTRRVYLSGEGEDIDLYKLAKFSLRRRADYLVIGEIRGEEAQLLPYAATSGHGVLATFHADSSSAAISRLTSPPFNLKPSQLASSISVIVVMSNSSRSGAIQRTVLEIAEINEDEGSKKVALKTIFSYDWNRRILLPVDVEELVKLSTILDHGNPEETLRKLAEKIRVLDSLMHISSYEEFYAVLKRYYLERLVKQWLV